MKISSYDEPTTTGTFLLSDLYLSGSGSTKDSQIIEIEVIGRWIAKLIPGFVFDKYNFLVKLAFRYYRYYTNYTN